MSGKLTLKIITPQKILVDEQVNAVFTKNIDGEIGILPGHITYMTPLDIGVTEYKTSSGSGFISLMGGMLQVKDNIVTILSDKAELGAEIDTARANSAKERAEVRLKETGSDIDSDRARIALARAIARISASSGKRY